MQRQNSHLNSRGAWGKRLRALKNVPPVLRIVWDSGPSVVVSTYALRVIAAIIPLLLLVVTRWIIDAIVARGSGPQPLPSMFWWWVVLEFVLASGGMVVGRAIGYFDSILADKFIRHISVRVMEHASRLDLACYENPAFYDKLERARVQATDRLVMVQAIGTIFQQAVTAFALAAGVVFFSPWLLVILVAFVVPAFLGDSHFAFQGYALNFQQTPVRRQLDYLRVLGASKEAAKELKLFGLSAFLTGRFSELSEEIYQQNIALASRRFRIGSLLSLISTMGYYPAYAYVVYRAVTGDISVGTLTFLAGAIAGTSTNVQMIFSTFSGIADQALFLTDLLEFFAERPAVQSKPDAIAAPRPIRKGFEFQNVAFRYPGRPEFVLDNLSFRLVPGERVALIGENGQGKTTVVKLLTRLYDPTAGRILLDGVDLRDYNLEDLCRQIAVVFQDFMRYDMTAAENIAVGEIGKIHQPLHVVAAAARSGAHSVIGKLPRGYQQMLGRRFDGGLDLSGGEWQKIALARAYLRGAQVLVLDEPTASLDARSEQEVFQRFAELTEGKMALLISHRFSTVRMADRILVLEGGKVAEQGSHSELVANGGRYYEMFELQAANYR
ncbi:MAG: ABC transporter ATP-binding protein [Acidobacteria bacterium]|nr:ABC transporter ATP-binding protein [Acidobacteriota bacterium]